MIEVRIQYNRVIEIECLLWQIHGDSCSATAQHGTDFVRESHITAKLILERIQKSFYANLESTLPAKCPLFVEWKVLPQVPCDSAFEGENNAIESPEVLNICDNNQETENDQKAIDKSHLPLLDGS